MESEHYQAGYRDGIDGVEPRTFSLPTWQQMYNEGYADGRRDMQGYITQQVSKAIRRGGC